MARAAAKGDMKTFVAANRQLAELLGLAAPKRSELSGPDGGPMQHEVDLSVLSDEELAEYERLERKVEGLDG
jgi:hypothetical protein